MKLRSIYLENFRSYKKLNLKIDNKKFILITGKNGTGKTNLLEAISFLSPGKGFRNCRLDEVIQRNLESKKCFAHFEIDNGNQKYDVGLDFSCKINDSLNFGRKIIQIDKKKIKKQSDLLNLISLIWLTPEMDIFFRSSSLIRRKFIDRCVYNLNSEYVNNLKIYETDLKERKKILKDLSSKDFFYKEGKNIEKDLWLKKIEEKLVKEGMKIYLERNKFVNEFNSISTNFKDFPKIKISLSGYIEELLNSKPEKLVEEEYLKKLHESRKIDSIKGSISYGPNKSDLKVLFEKKKIWADKCSTGEQKIILISLVIQFCKLINNNKENLPILLLDEVAAHLDKKVRLSLYEELKSLKNQIWMSGADIKLFSPINNEKESVNLEIEDLLKQ